MTIPLSLVLAAFAFGTLARAQTYAPTPIDSSISPREYITNAMGSFSEDVPIAVPVFHGITPNVRLDYNSSTHMNVRRSGSGFIGAGWQLDGIPTIDRVSPGLGAPFSGGAALGSDTFMFDGQEMVACPTTGATSPGCLAGGNYMTRTESYQRILYNGTNWIVTARDGTISTFTPTGLGVATAPATGTLVPAVARWVLSTVQDTQGNTVTYGWLS